MVGSASSSRTTSENCSSPETPHRNALNKEHHINCENLASVGSGLNIRAISIRQAIVREASVEPDLVPETQHTAITVVDQSKTNELDVPSETALAALRHRYAFFSLKFTLGVHSDLNVNRKSHFMIDSNRVYMIVEKCYGAGMIHFALTVWLVVEYEVWPVMEAAMQEMPVYGWSLVICTAVSSFLYVFENTLWFWYRDIPHRKWHCLDGCRALYMRIRHHRNRQRTITNTDL